SVETAADARDAMDRGYAPALVVETLPADGRAWREGGTTFIPCPAETRGRTCVECRLCFDADALLSRRAGIAFGAPGSGQRKVRETLVQIRMKKEVFR